MSSKVQHSIAAKIKYLVQQMALISQSHYLGLIRNRTI